MSECKCRGLNGFSCMSKCRSCCRNGCNTGSDCECHNMNDCKRKSECNGCSKKKCKNDCCRTKDAYASIYTKCESVKIITFPGEVIPVTFSKNAIVNENMSHEEGSAILRTCIHGDYKIDFEMNIFSNVSAVATFAIQVNGINIPSGTFSSTLALGHQYYGGSTMVSLSACDVVRLIFTAPAALSITLSNTTMNAVLQN